VISRQATNALHAGWLDVTEVQVGGEVTALSVPPLLGFTRHLCTVSTWICKSCSDHVLSGIKVVKLFALETHVPVNRAVTDPRAPAIWINARRYLNGTPVTHQIQCVLPVHTELLEPIALQPSCRNTIVRINAGTTASRQFSLHHLEQRRKN
jgi:hypothetical protein